MFITCPEQAVKELSWERKEINIDGESLINFRFEVNIVLKWGSLGEAKTPQELQNSKYIVRLKIYFSKTKMMTNVVPNEQIRQ